MTAGPETAIAVSIITAVYNEERFLEDAINSALRQSLKNIELICIDDGSTDGSPQILSRLREMDDRVRIITQENMGAGAARNAGLKAARGSYIAFLDADDMYPNETCLEELYELAVTHQAKIAGGSLLFLENGHTSRAITKSDDFTFHASQSVKYRDFQQAYYYQRFIYSRDMLNKADICFPEYRRFQDVVFFVRAMTEGCEFIATEAPVYIYRKSENYRSLTDQQINDMLRGYIDVLTIAKTNSFSDLFSFLSGRISANQSIVKMVRSSIRSGNQTADKLYAEVLDICGKKDGSSHIINWRRKAARVSKRLSDSLKALLSGFRK